MVTGAATLVAVNAMRGSSSPRLVLVISSMALALGVGLLIPTFCAAVCNVVKSIQHSIKCCVCRLVMVSIMQ